MSAKFRLACGSWRRSRHPLWLNHEFLRLGRPVPARKAAKLYRTSSGMRAYRFLPGVEPLSGPVR
jgi:hypothetical protein